MRGRRATDALRRGLRAIPRVRLLDDAPARERLAIVSLRIDDWEVEEVGFVLRESFGIACRTGLHCAPLVHAAIGSAPDGTIRLSPSGATGDAEIDYTLDAVGRLAA